MPRKGFFRQSQLTSKKIKNSNNTTHCKKCKLNEKSKTPYMKLGGSGEIKILHVAQTPELLEDRKNEYFISKAGSFYKRKLRKLGIDLDECSMTYACVCHSPRNKKPTKTQIKACNANILKTIKEVQPHVIIALGEAALEALIGNRLNKEISSVAAYRGFIIPDREYNAWICPIYHPNYVLAEYSPEISETLFELDLKQAVAMLNVPLPKFENEQDKVSILKHKKEIIAFLKHVLYDYSSQEFMTAFDYEGTGLKPQRKEQKLYTCSIALTPNYVAAFPMLDDSEFLNLLCTYLKNHRIKKIAANIGFEHTWSQVKLGTQVKGWFYDTMNGQHHIDNRPHICSLEFQNFIYFGIEPYDQHVKKYLKTEKGGNQLNRIHECDMYDLLLYNGMDSLTEYRLALVQMELINKDFYKYYDSITNPRPQDLAPQYFINRK